MFLFFNGHNSDCNAHTLPHKHFVGLTYEDPDSNKENAVVAVLDADNSDK